MRSSENEFFLIPGPSGYFQILENGPSRAPKNAPIFVIIFVVITKEFHQNIFFVMLLPLVCPCCNYITSDIIRDRKKP